MSRTDLSEDGAVVLATLASPSRGLASAAARRRSLTAIGVATLASLLLAAAAVPRPDFAAAADARPREPGAEEPTPHEREEARLQAAKVGALAGWAGASLGPALTVLGAALALWLGFKVAGTRPDLRATVAVTAHALLPVALARLLAVPAALAHAPLRVEELPLLLPSSAAALLPPGSAPALAAAAASLDLFVLWALALLVAGMVRVTGATRLRAAAVVGVLWLAQVALLGVVPAAAAARALRGGA
jgi:hypothetical protein